MNITKKSSTIENEDLSAVEENPEPTKVGYILNKVSVSVNDKTITKETEGKDEQNQDEVLT